MAEPAAACGVTVATVLYHRTSVGQARSTSSVTALFVKTIQKSVKLDNVCYDIRGPVFEKIKQMEEDGHKIIKLSIGNLALFDFDTPEGTRLDMIRNLPNSAGYSDSKSIFTMCRAMMHYTQEQDIKNVTLDDICLGNGASELISLATNVLLDADDELLLPAPDYPLWTAVTSLSDSTPVYYTCDEANGWMPDLGDIRAKITPSTKGVVVINPNNPTGALYSDKLLLGIVAITREHGLVTFADEVYDKVLLDDNKHAVIGSLSEDVLMVAFDSLSKSYRLCGYRAGWMVMSGGKCPVKDYTEGLNMFPPMRLRANMPGQWAIQTALGGYQGIKDPVVPGSHIRRQRDLAHELIMTIPGMTCMKLKAVPYMFPHLNPAVYPIEDDQTFIRQLLEEERVLLVRGIGFNWHSPDRFRIIFLPHEDDLREAVGRVARFLEQYRQHHGTDIRAA